MYELNQNTTIYNGNHVVTIIIRRRKLSENGIRFLDGFQYAEDTLWRFYVHILWLYEKIRVISAKNPIYFYRVHPESTIHTFNEAVHVNRVKALMKMSAIYREELFYNSHNPVVKEHIEARIQRATQALLIASSGLSSYDDRHQLIQELKKQKLYPYSLIWGNLKINKTLKQTIFGWMYFLLPFEPYYWIFSTISSVYRRKKHA